MDREQRSEPMTRIRTATPDDAAAIAHVHVEGWRTAYMGLLSDQLLTSLSEAERRLQWRSTLAQPLGEFVLVAEQDHHVIGFASGGRERKGDPHFLGEIYALYLLNAYRSRGIGTALFGRCAEMLAQSGINSMKVWVLRDNPFRPFYERMGGQQIGDDVTRIGGQDLVQVAYGWSDLWSVKGKSHDVNGGLPADNRTLEAQPRSGSETEPPRR